MKTLFHAQTWNVDMFDPFEFKSYPIETLA